MTGHVRRDAGRALASLSILALVLSVVGCESVEIIRLIEPPPAYTDGDLTVTATVLGTAELTARYGSRNPFLPPMRLITPVDFFVIELAVSAPSDLPSIRSQDINFEFGNTGVRKPVSAHRLGIIWQNEIDIHGSNVVRSNYRRLIRTFIIPRDVGGNTVGLLLFQGNFPFAGTARLSLPHFAPERGQHRDPAEQDETVSHAGFDGERIYFHFVIDFEERREPFRFF